MKSLSIKGLFVGLIFLIFSGYVSINSFSLLTQYFHFNKWVVGILSILFYFFFNIVLFRLILFFLPESKRIGSLVDNPSLDWMYDIYLTQSLFCFQLITESKLFPIPIRTLMIKSLGAKIGSQTFPSGTITDPFLFSAGENCVIGLGSILTGHAAVVGRVKLAKIELGNRVTIGGNVLIYPGVTIGDNSIIAGGSVVLENQKIPPNEIWGGVPAKFIKNINDSSKI